MCTSSSLLLGCESQGPEGSSVTPCFRWQRVASVHGSTQLNAGRRLSHTSVLCRLIAIPEWLAAPGKYQRYWVRYTLAGVASLWALRFLYMYALASTQVS